MLIFIVCLGCSEGPGKEGDTAAGGKDSIFGSWQCYERDGLAYPYTYEGSETLEIVDHDVLSVWQDMQLTISEDYTGELISFIEITENNGEIARYWSNRVSILLIGRSAFHSVVATKI